MFFCLINREPSPLPLCAPQGPFTMCPVCSLWRRFVRLLPRRLRSVGQTTQLSLIAASADARRLALRCRFDPESLSYATSHPTVSLPAPALAVKVMESANRAGCALLTTGAIVCFSILPNKDAQYRALSSTGTDVFVDFALSDKNEGLAHVCGLTTLGSIRCWPETSR